MASRFTQQFHRRGSAPLPGSSTGALPSQGHLTVRFAIFLSMGLLVFGGCSFDARPDPKDTIKNMFEAMRTSDSVALAANVDLESAARDMQQELATPEDDTGGMAPDWGARLLGEMTAQGRLRKRWLTDNQIVLGKSEISEDTALVEVSFLDRITRVQYYNKMRLVFRQGRWVVTDFRTM